MSAGIRLKNRSRDVSTSRPLVLRSWLYNPNSHARACSYFGLSTSCLPFRASAPADAQPEEEAEGLVSPGDVIDVSASVSAEGDIGSTPTPPHTFLATSAHADLKMALVGEVLGCCLPIDSRFAPDREKGDPYSLALVALAMS